MVLVDTSVWVNHLARSNNHLSKLLLKKEVVIHPFIIGELACGSIKNRNEVLGLLQLLPSVKQATFEEYLKFIESRHLIAKNIGFVDIHLCASALLGNVKLWTLDKKLAAAAEGLKITYLL